jgi:predicted DNA-binding antitoxin AbrB/MazE fold protein
MSQIEAIFRRGVFQPLEPVHLPEEQRVRLSVEPTASQAVATWLKDVQSLQAAVVQREGQLPDSANEIAADRLR